MKAENEKLENTSGRLAQCVMVAQVLLLERASTLNTGTADGEFVHEKSRAGVSLTKRELERI